MFDILEDRGVSSVSLEGICNHLNKKCNIDNASFAIIGEDTKKDPRYCYGACHAGLNNWYRDNSTKAVAVLTQVMKRNSKESLKYRWWLANESPWADAYISKEESFILKNGLVTDPENVPNGLFQGANILARSPNEFKSRVKIWNKLVFEYSVEPLEAFFTMCVLHEYKDKNYFGAWNNHSATYPHVFPKQCYINIKNGDIVKKFEKSTFNTLKRYSDVFAIWGFEDHPKRSTDKLSDFIKRNLSSLNNASLKACDENPFGPKIRCLVNYNKQDQITVPDGNLKEFSNLVNHYFLEED